MDRDDGQRWAFNLQPLAERLARDCDAAARTLAEIDSLEKQQKFDEALTVARATAAKTSITALKAAMLTLDSQLQKSNEQYQAQLQRTQLEQARLQQQRDQEEQKRAAEEARAIQTVEASLAATWQNYDFNGALAKYAAAAEQVQTENGRRAIQQRQSAIKLLVELKQQLAADFARAPYDGANLRTRSNAPFSGRLTRATDSQLIFATPYGEVAANWRDLPPAEWVKLADSYIATLGKSEATEAVARRCLRLAVFCKQYGMERAAANYAQRATQTLPALQREVDVALGKPPG
jgi:hypothetical protein